MYEDKDLDGILCETDEQILDYYYYQPTTEEEES